MLVNESEEEYPEARSSPVSLQPEQTMNDSGNSPKQKMSWRRAGVGSFLAGFVGWVSLNVFLLVFHLLTAPKPLQGFNGFGFMALGSGFIILVVWIAFLLPIYHEFSSESPVWRWPISTLLGAFVGYLVMSLFIYVSTPHDTVINNKLTLYLFNFFHFYALLCGTSTGLFAGLTTRYFHGAPNRSS